MRLALARLAVAFSILIATPSFAATATLAGTVVDTNPAKDPRVVQPFVIPAGETSTISIVVKHSSGTVYNLTGGQLLLTVRQGSNVLIGRQATIDVAASGTAHFPIVIADTLSLRGACAYDVWLTDPSGNRYQVVMSSPWTVTQAHGQPGQAVTVPATQQPLALGPGSIIVWNQTTPWSAVLAKIQAAASAGYGVTLLEVDDGTFSPFVIDQSANLDNVQIVGLGGETITLFSNTFQLLGTTLNASGTALRVQSNIFSGPLLYLNLNNSGVVHWNGYSGSVFTIAANGYAGITLVGGSLDENSLKMGQGSGAFAQLRSGGELDDATFQTANGVTASVDVVVDPTCFIDSPLLWPGITFTTSPSGIAHYGKYVPTTSSNWSVQPATVGDALDKLATPSNDKLAQYANGSRPAASTMGFRMIYNTTSNKINVSDGTNWRDAIGNLAP